MAELTNKQRVFVEEYLRCWNATEAARLAGYKNPRQAGSENLSKPDIATEVKTRITEKTMSADEVLNRLSDHARSTMADFLDEAEENLDLAKAAVRGKLHLVKKFTKTDKGTSIELYDAQAALVHIGRHHGLFVDKTALTDPTGQKEYAGLSDTEITAKLAAILDTARTRAAGVVDE